MQFFHIPNRAMCLSKKILYQYFVVFLPCLRQFLLWKHVIDWLVKLWEWNNRHPVYQFLKFILDCRFTFKAYAKT